MHPGVNRSTAGSAKGDVIGETRVALQMDAAESHYLAWGGRGSSVVGNGRIEPPRLGHAGRRQAAPWVRRTREAPCYLEVERELRTTPLLAELIFERKKERNKIEKALARFSVERALYTFHVFEYDSFHGPSDGGGTLAFFIVLFCVYYVPSSFRVLGTLLLSWVSEVVAKWCVLVCVFSSGF